MFPTKTQRRRSTKNTKSRVINMAFYYWENVVLTILMMPNRQSRAIIGSVVDSCNVSHIDWLINEDQFKSPYFQMGVVTELGSAVVYAHHTPRRLCFPAPLFSLAGGLSHREAVLTQRIHTTVGNTDKIERGSKKLPRLSGSPRLGLLACLIRTRYRKSWVWVLLMLRLAWRCVPVFGY